MHEKTTRDSQSEADQRCPVAALASTQDARTIYRPEPAGPYLVNSYELCCEVLRQPALFGTEVEGEHTATQSDERQQQELRNVFLKEGWLPGRATLLSDGTRHRMRRNFLVQSMPAKRIRALQPFVEQKSQELLDSFVKRKEIDFGREFAQPLALTVISELIGLPSTDMGLLQRWSDAAIDTGTGTQERQVECAHVLVSMQKFVMQKIQDRKKSPRNDLLTELANATDESGKKINPIEQLTFIISDLFFPGSAFPASALTYGMLLLTQNNAIATELQSNRTLIPSFVEEVLRLESSVVTIHRQAREDTTLGGMRLKKADILDLRLSCANRTELQFEQASRVDLHRKTPGKHLGFGIGRHFCIGAALTRVELTVAFSSLLDRYDSFALSQDAELLQHKHTRFMRALRALPIILTAKATHSATPS